MSTIENSSSEESWASWASQKIGSGYETVKNSPITEKVGVFAKDFLKGAAVGAAISAPVSVGVAGVILYSTRDVSNLTKRMVFNTLAGVFMNNTVGTGLAYATGKAVYDFAKGYFSSNSAIEQQSAEIQAESHI